MNLKCNGQLEIKCDKCGHIITIDCHDLPFDVVETQEGNMGTEKCHSADYEFDCPHCGNKISIKYDIWEYPDGSINNVDIEITGGTVVQECNFSMEE